MQRSLFSLLGLITLWSLFYAGFKYFFWGVYEHETFAPTLEQISGYVLLGSMIAYTLGGPLYARYSERKMLYISIILGILFFLIGGFLPVIEPIFFNLSMVGLGFSYSLYVIGKNTLIGREIATSKLSSSAIGAFTTVTFILFLIIGTITGAKLGETSSLFLVGIGYFVCLLILATLDIYFAKTRSEKTKFVFSFDLYKKLFFRYGIFMIGLACFWQISVEASQVAINYSKEVFGKANSTSSLLLLFSSLGAILGNILSVKIAKWRLQSFLVLTSFFILVVFTFSSILGLAESLDIYPIVQGLAFVIGFFFGGAVNLAESYFFSLLGNDENKDYTSALYGFTLSLVGALMMFLSEKILHSYSYGGISIFLGLLAILALYGGWKGIQIKE